MGLGIIIDKVIIVICGKMTSIRPEWMSSSIKTVSLHLSPPSFCGYTDSIRGNEFVVSLQGILQECGNHVCKYVCIHEKMSRCLFMIRCVDVYACMSNDCDA